MKANNKIALGIIDDLLEKEMNMRISEKETQRRDIIEGKKNEH